MDICNTVESVTVVNGVTSTGKKRKRREAPFIVEEPIKEEVNEPIMATKVTFVYLTPYQNITHE